MKQESSIFIKNVYYMLAYAFRILTSEQYEKVEAEPFDNVHDLFAAILSKGISRQLKQGLYREYVAHSDDLTTLRGKIDMPGTVKLRIGHQRELACDFDELSENNLLNQILKTTSLLLIRHGEVSRENRASLKQALMFFSNVDVIEPNLIRWSTIRFSRNTQSYQMLITICQLVLKGLLITTQSGEHKLMSFLDDQAMSRLYEKFILEYYVKHWPRARPRSPRIEWKLDEGEPTMLPVMQSDITLTSDEKVLIIDAKYYTKNTQERFSSHTIHSANLYQIFTYVKNQEASDPNKDVAGMLLYARTDQEIQPDARWRIHGNEILTQTLDLGHDFPIIAAQLDEIVLANFALSEVDKVR